MILKPWGVIWKEVREGPVSETHREVLHWILPGDKQKMQNRGYVFCTREERKLCQSKTDKAPDLCRKGKSKLQSKTAPWNAFELALAEQGQ